MSTAHVHTYKAERGESLGDELERNGLWRIAAEEVGDVEIVADQPGTHAGQ